MCPLENESGTPWQTIHSEIIHENPWFAIVQDKVLTHTGKQITYTYMKHPGAVAIVPVTHDGRIILIQQYRHTVKDWCWEIPMGGKEYPDSEKIVHKELWEEVGGTSENIQYITSFYGNNGVSDIRCEVFIAWDVKTEENNPEDAELIRVVTKPKHEVLGMARQGQIEDGLSALAILLCENLLVGY
jgi:8-oxo-dGTP pyrophosphatase MutT (NUDIX family)